MIVFFSTFPHTTVAKEVTKELILRNFLSVIAFYSTFPQCALVTQCGNYTNLLSHFLTKISPKRRFLPKKLRLGNNILTEISITVGKITKPTLFHSRLQSVES